MKPLLKLTLFMVLLSSATAFAAGDEAQNWIRKSDRFRAPGDSFSVLVKVIASDANEKKESQFRVASKGKHFTLVEQTSPERQAGRKLLMRDRDLWLYSPNVSRPTRISFEQKLTGEVANGDIMRTNFDEDYTATLRGEEKLAKVNCVKLHLIAKSKDVTYNSIDYWVDKASGHPVKAVFFALSGKALKTATYFDFKPTLGATLLTKVEISDALQANKKSILMYAAFKREKFTDAYFSKESLNP